MSRGPVVFLVLSHHMPRLLDRLLSRLSDTESAVTVVHHDVKASELPDVRAYPRTHLVPDPLDVRWGDITQVNATLRSMAWARREVPDYSWMVLISGQDYPVQSPRRTEAELLATDVDAFIQWEPVPRLPGRFATAWQRGVSPRYFRRSVRRADQPGLVPRVRMLLDGVQVHAGAQWWNLSRATIERMYANEPFFEYLKRRFDPVVLPEEAFFQTAVLTFPRELVLANTSRRFYRFPTIGKTLHPHTLTIDDLPAMQASNAFFVRKVDPDESAELLDALDREP